MDTDHAYQHSAEHIHNPDVDHEMSDVNVRGILGFGAGLVVCTLLVCFVLYGMFDLLRKQFTTEPLSSTTMVGTREPREASAEAAKEIFPEPRLQTNYFGDLAAVRKDWNDELNGYGWVDQKAGVVHIPIEQAMRLTLQRGLPARSGAVQSPVSPETKTAKAKKAQPKT